MALRRRGSKPHGRVLPVTTVFLVTLAVAGVGLASAAYDRTLELQTLRAVRVLLQDDADVATSIAQAPPSPSPPPPKTPKEDGPEWWMYVVIPVVSAVVGWSTNVLALQMTFYPLAFFPACLAWTQIPGQPMGWLLIGWQGIIPSKAAEMAEIVTTLMTTKLIDIKDVFQRLDPPTLAANMRTGIYQSMRRVLHETAMAECEGVWTATPQHVKEEILEVAMERSTPFIAGLIEELQNDLYSVFDVVAMSRRLASARRELIVHIFQEVGASEFTFIEHSGAYFGFLFGLMQALVYAFYDAWWVLPAAGFVVGFATNYLALLFIFKPIEPTKVLCFTMHGAFLRRQAEVSEKFAELLAQHFVNSSNMWEEILHGVKKDQFETLFKGYANGFFLETVGMGKLLMGMVVGDESYRRINNRILEGLYNEFRNMIPHGYDYCDEALKIQQTLEGELKKLPPADFEGVLHPAFEADELKLILVGGALGLLAGVLQQFVIFNPSF